MFLVSARIYPVLIFAALFSLVQVPPSYSEEWTYNKEVVFLDDGSVAPTNKVTKWCAENGTDYVYSNLTSAAFRECGEIEMQVSCDATGSRYFGREKAPHGFLDCAIGPRIQIKGRSVRNEANMPISLRALSPSKKDLYFKELDALIERN